MRAAADALPGSGDALRRFDLALKRLIDISGAAVGLLIAAPLFLVVAAIIRATSPGPALLRQTRIGKDGKPFALFKFRSMYVDAEARRAALEQHNQHGADGVTFKLRRDPRVTPVGRLLRRSSIDEMPQLWNVLIGDMSLVGPRPPLPAEVARYLPRQHRRLEAKPGLTCLWQVGGRSDLPFERQVDLDIEYLARRNTLLDLVILLRTVPAVLTARGAY
jgi:lipopolysaccharide/colanic/teichoic acid biosynthesis glycosyltransferase